MRTGGRSRSSRVGNVVVRDVVEGATSHHEVLRARKHGATEAARLGADEP
jgi:hypothetical protein